MTSKLAIDGGAPVRSTLLPYGHQVIDDDDVQAVVGVLRSDWLTTGPEVQRFEEAFAASVGANHAVALSSGTAALHAASFAAGIVPGSEAITTPLTFAASANCIRYQGGTVVFADVEPGTLNISPQRVREAITPSTKAVICVDYAGQPADIEELAAICHEHGIVLIEDAAHSLGATYRGRTVGSLADMTVFSLHPVKHITAGEGGVVTTASQDIAERLRSFRNHGITVDHHERQAAGSWYYEMTDLGYNYRITDIQCALATSQLRKLPAWVERRRATAAAYTRAFSQLPEVSPLTIRDDREPSWHIYPVQLDLSKSKTDRKGIFAALRAENIGVNVHYIPVPWHPYYQALGYEPGHWPEAEAAYARLVTLPLWPGMSDTDADDVVAAVTKVVEAYRV
jgi:perosamine synthetase